MDVPVYDECTVSGALGLVLLVSKILGLAPLKFKRVRDGWRIRLSPAASLYGKAVVSFVCITMLLSFIVDFKMSQKLSTYFRTSSDTAAWIARAIFVISPLVAVTYFGFRRMQCVINSLAQLEKINEQLNQYGTLQRFENNIMLISLSSLLGLCLIPCARCGLVLYYSKLNKRSFFVEVVYVPFYIAVIMTKLVILQITFIFSAVPAHIHHVNNCLRNLLRPIHNEDAMMTPASSVKYLRIIHESLCSVVKDIDGSHGVILVTFMPNLLSGLVFTLFQIIINLFLTIALQTLYVCIFMLAWHFVAVISARAYMLKGYRINDIPDAVIEQTKRVIAQSLLFTPPEHHEVIHELELFYKHLIKDVVYIPMGIFYLNRTVIVTIVASITTYLVVIVGL